MIIPSPKQSLAGIKIARNTKSRSWEGPLLEFDIVDSCRLKIVLFRT